MTPVEQTIMHCPGVSRGNCMQAVVASLLDLDLMEVPNFAEEKLFWGSVITFLNARGLRIIDIPLRVKMPDAYYLATGPSPRSTDAAVLYHAVVMRGGRVVWDPHPSRAGLLHVATAQLIVDEFSSHYWRRALASVEDYSTLTGPPAPGSVVGGL